MSRIGKQPVEIPAGVDVSIDGSEVTIKGSKGELTQRFDPDLTIEVDNGSIVVTRPTDQRRHRALHGLTRALIANMVEGVNTGYRKDLRIEGTGYRAEMTGDGLKLSLGYSHDIMVVPPPSVELEVPKDSRGQHIIITSHDKVLIGQIAADIRKLRPPEPYKGKGIRYQDEIVRRKAGKAKVGT